MKEVLIISPYFPPIGGSGVYRLHRWTKYLPEFGIQPLVVHYDRLPGEPLDRSLLGELSDHVERFPVRFVEPSGRGIRAWLKRDAGDAQTVPAGGGGQGPGAVTALVGWLRDRLLIPDLSVSWLLPARAAIRKIMRERHPAAVISTYSPGAAHLLGLWVKRHYGLPWIADFRDPWTDAVVMRKRFWPLSALEGRMERSVVLKADRVTVYSEGLGELLWKKIGATRPEKFLSLGPAVDTDKFDRVPASDRKYDFLYTGALEDYYPLEFFFALEQVNERRQASGERPLRAGIAGKTGARLRQTLERFTRPGWLDLLGYLPHREALALLKSARCLVLLHTEQGWWVPGKVAEYLYSGKPVLAVVGEGELKEMLAKFDRVMFGPDERGQLAGLLEQASALKDSPRRIPKELTARGQAGRIAELVETMSERR